MNEIAKHISINPEIRFGKPCIAGSRIAISDILGWLASGMTEQEIIEDYPSIKLEHIKASLSFAAHREEVIRIITS